MSKPKPTVEQVRDALLVLCEANGGVYSCNEIHLVFGNGIILQGVTTGIDRVPQAILDMSK